MRKLMTTPCWWLVDKLSQALDPDERDVVRGDFAESGTSAGQALRDLLGLIARRQAALCKDWRPWLALLGIVVPVATILSQHSYQLHGSVIRYLVIPWQFGVRYQTGLTLAEDIIVFVSLSAALVVWSWTAGLALGSLSQRTVWVQALLFCLVGTFPAWMLLLAWHPWVSLLLLLWNTAFLLLPAVLGARWVCQRGALGMRRTVLLALVMMSVTALALWTGTWRQLALENWSEGVYQARFNWPKRVLPYLALIWPTAYLLAAERWRLGQGKTRSQV